MRQTKTLFGGSWCWIEQIVEISSSAQNPKTKPHKRRVAVCGVFGDRWDVFILGNDRFECLDGLKKVVKSLHLQAYC